MAKTMALDTAMATKTMAIKRRVKFANKTSPTMENMMIMITKTTIR